MIFSSIRRKNKMTENTLVIYHGECSDGIAGAWCFKKLGYKNFYAGTHNNKIDIDIKDKDIIFVDFIYPKDQLKNILKEAKSVNVLDHHKSSLFVLDMKHENLKCMIDMLRSGAQIAWDFCFPDEKERSWFIDDIGDRDLWLWKRVDSKEATTGMFKLGCCDNIDMFDNITLHSREYYIEIGKLFLINDKNRQKNICKKAIKCKAQSKIDPEKEWNVMIVECDKLDVSEVGNQLVTENNCDFAVMYKHDFLKNEWNISSRANVNNNIDLTKIVRHFDSNGGGHPKASGFTLRGDELYKVFKII